MCDIFCYGVFETYTNFAFLPFPNIEKGGVKGFYANTNLEEVMCTGVNFTKILQAAFTLSDSKIVKNGLT